MVNIVNSVTLCPPSFAATPPEQLPFIAVSIPAGAYICIWVLLWLCAVGPNRCGRAAWSDGFDCFIVCPDAGVRVWDCVDTFCESSGVRACDKADVDGWADVRVLALLDVSASVCTEPDLETLPETCWVAWQELPCPSSDCSDTVSVYCENALDWSFMCSGICSSQCRLQMLRSLTITGQLVIITW